jgi:hypothetical protein
MPERAVFNYGELEIVKKWGKNRMDFKVYPCRQQ